MARAGGEDKMRTDGIECWNKDCVHRDELFQFSCRAHDDWIVSCQKFMKRTPEHEAVAKTLKGFCDQYRSKINLIRKFDAKSDTFLAAMSIANTYMIVINDLAHNWINRRKEK